MSPQETHPIVPGDTLGVWYDGQLVGHVMRRGQAVYDIGFRYAESWTGSADSFPISISMPISTIEHEPAIVYPWFLNLLPEGRTRQIVGHVLRVHEADVFAMLAEMGRDLPGALDIRRNGTTTPTRTPRYRRLSDSELAEAIRRLPDRPLLVGEDGVHMSLAGAQEKLAVVRYNDGAIGLALDGAPTTHILKPRNKKFRAAVENEAFCLRLAQAVNLPAARVSMHRVEDIDYLLVQRYDRTREDGKIRRIHQEDLCQAADFPPYLKYEWNRDLSQHGPGLKTCMDALEKSSVPGLNKLKFFEFMLFNVLCGNVDAHAKNFSLMIRRGGSITMAPLYDVMNGDIYEGVTRNLVMKIAGKQRGGYIFGRHWDRFAKENNLSATGVRRRVKDLSAKTLEALPAVIKEMEGSNMPSPVYKEIGGYVAGYCRDMINNLKRDPTPDEEESDEAEVSAATVLSPGAHGNSGA